MPIEELQCDASKPYNSGDSCYPLDRTTEPSWSLKEVFGRPVKGACLLGSDMGSASSEVCLSVPPDREVHIQAPANYGANTLEQGRLRCYQPASEFTFLSADIRLC